MVDPIITPIVILGPVVTGATVILTGLLFKGLWFGGCTICNAVANAGYKYLNVSLQDDNIGALSLIRLLSNRFGNEATERTRTKFRKFKATTIGMPDNDTGKTVRKTFYIPLQKWITIRFNDCSFDLDAIFEQRNNINRLIGFNLRSKNSDLMQIMEYIKHDEKNLKVKENEPLFSYTIM